MISLCRSGPVLATTFLCSALSASAQDSAVTLGKREAIQSKILGEKRDILVSVPQQMKPNMPLLIVWTGSGTFSNVAVVVNHLTGNGRLPPMVVAGVVNTNQGARSDAGVRRIRVSRMGLRTSFLHFWLMN